jgi:hypothetical protein
MMQPSATVTAAAAAAIFLLLMDRIALTLPDKAAPPVPGDCSPSPYHRRRPAADDEDNSYEDDENVSSPETTPIGGGGGLHLDCLLSAINSDAERTNFSVIPAAHTVSLTVTCADELVSGALEPEGFRSLVWLEALAVERCNLAALPPRAFVGLNRLRSLKAGRKDI